MTSDQTPRQSAAVRRSRPTRGLTLAACAAMTLLTACNSIPGLGSLGGLLGGGAGGIIPGLGGGPGGAFTLLLSALQLVPPPPNPLESEFLAPLGASADLSKLIFVQPLPRPIDPLIVAVLPEEPAYGALGPDGLIYYTERYSGRVRAFDPAANTVLPDPVIDLPVNISGERGLKGIAFSTNGGVMYLSYDRSSTDGDTAGPNEVLDARLSAFPFSAGKVTGPESLIFATPAFDAAFPSDINGIGPCLVAPDGFLYLAHGDRNSRFSVLDLAVQNASGRILRFNQDGTIPSENPNPDSPGVASGFREPSSMAVDPETGLFYVMDIGSTVSDEFNVLVPGRFYGWPLVQGVANSTIEDNSTQLTSLVYQTPLIDFGYDRISPRGATIVRGATYGPALNGNLFVGQSNVVPAVVHRFQIDSGLFIFRSVAFTAPAAGGAVRDLVQGPDGRIYVFCQNELYVLNPA